MVYFMWTVPCDTHVFHSKVLLQSLGRLYGVNKEVRLLRAKKVESAWCVLGRSGARLVVHMLLHLEQMLRDRGELLIPNFAEELSPWVYDRECCSPPCYQMSM